MVALALSDGVPLFELAGPCAIFGKARGAGAAAAADGAWYTFKVCGPPRARIDDWFTASTPYTYDDLITADTVIVPACHDEIFTPPDDLVAAVRTAHERGARIASICTGAFVLAAAGVLDGRRAATHWMHASTLARRYPALTVDSSPLYIDDGDVLTSAGKSAGIDLCLHMVRKDFGAEVANQIARRLVAPPHREGHQRQYAQPVAAPGDADAFGEVLSWAQTRLDQPLTVDQLARHANVSVRTLHRHFVSRAGVTPLDWLNEQRIRRAQQLLEGSHASVERIAAECGFGTSAALRRHFRESLGTTPDAYRRTFTTAST